MIYSKIIATGSALPQTMITNDNLNKTLNISHEWITRRTGIKQRHIAVKNIKTSDLATLALHNALNKCLVKPNDLDGIILATTTPDRVFPSTAITVQNNIKMTSGFAFDVQAACSGFLYALQIADIFIRQQKYRKIAIIGADVMSKIVDWNDKNTCVLFGDGAGAIILGAIHNNKNQGILGTEIYSDGSFINILKVSEQMLGRSKQKKILMDGQEVFKNAIIKMKEAIIHLLNNHDKNIQDIDFLLLHQANSKIIKAVARKLGLNQKKILSSVQYHANTSAASIPLCLDEHLKKQSLVKGSLIITAAAGAGLTWGTALFYI